MKPALIFRLVTASGEGFYRHIDAHEQPDRNPLAAVTAAHRFTYMLERPDPAHDLERLNPKDSYGYTVLSESWKQGFHLSGFASLKQARRWFSSKRDLHAWAKLGVRLQVYLGEDCSSVHVAKWQLIFHPNDGARHIELPADTLINATDEELLAKLRAPDHRNDAAFDAQFRTPWEQRRLEQEARYRFEEEELRGMPSFFSVLPPISYQLFNEE